MSFKPSAPPAFLDAAFADEVRAARNRYARALQGHRLSFVLGRQMPWHHFARRSVEQSQLTVRSPFLDNALVECAYRAPTAVLLDTSLRLHLVAEGNRRMAEIETDRGMRFGGDGPGARWRRRWREVEIKAEYASDYGMPHAAAHVDALLKPLHLERFFLGRHKFYHFRVWYRDRLSRYVREILLDGRTRSRGYLDSARVERMVRDHIAGRRNHTLDIHKALSCELIERSLIETS